MGEEIRNAKKAGATVIGSVFGARKEEFIAAAVGMEKAGVDAVELNLSCPMLKEVWRLGHNPELTKGIVRGVKSNVSVPVFSKLPGNTYVPNLLEVARAAEKAGADGITLANTFPGLALDINASRPILGDRVGGLAGPGIKPLTLRLVYEAYKVVGVPIIGCGGISSASDAIEYFLAGASAVQIGTGIMYKGVEIFEEICEGTRSFMREKGFKEVKEMVGLAHSP
jgi:dihydroorotate dehydrogenase (NAD+) catalytic subunit